MRVILLFQASWHNQTWNMHFCPPSRGGVDSRRLFLPLGPQCCILATMARPPRIDFPDAVYHVTSRGNGRDVIFWSDADRERFLGQLADNLRTAAVVLYAYVLMDNHIPYFVVLHVVIYRASCSGY